MFLDKQVNELYLYEVLRVFGNDLIGIFIPIYLVSQGFGFEYALGFLVAEYTTSIILSIPVALLVSRIGFKHSMALSYVFVLPALLLLRSSSLTVPLLGVSAFVYGLGKIFHSLSFESEFAVDSHQEKRDSESTKILGLPNISRTVAPVAGGYLLSFFGFNMLVSISILFFLFSIAVLAKSGDHRDPLSYDLRSMVKENYSTTFPVFFIRGILNITAVTIFALFTFFFIGSEIDAGYVAAVDNLGLMAAAVISGGLVQRYGRRKVIIAGLLGSSAIHLSRIFASTPLEAFAVSGIGGAIFMLYEVPLFSNYADQAEKEDVLEFYTAKRMLFKTGQILTILLIIGVALKTGLKQGFQAAFILAAVASMLVTLWTRKEWTRSETA